MLMKLFGPITLECATYILNKLSVKFFHLFNGVLFLVVYRQWHKTPNKKLVCSRFTLQEYVLNDKDKEKRENFIKQRTGSTENEC